ncbi:MAG: GAF domain-containing protein [Spirochaetia bacterium]|nr:GAF domain-containing protein [Spirochaetia bacterium]
MIRLAMVCIWILFSQCSPGPGTQEIDLTGEWTINFSDRPEFKDPAFNGGTWQKIAVPSNWSDLKEHSGIAWYRKSFNVPPGFLKDSRAIALAVMDADETFLNGIRIGSAGSMTDSNDHAYAFRRIYPIPRELIVEGQNLLAVRVRPLSNQGAGLRQGNVILGDLHELENSRTLTELRQISLSAVYVAVGLYFLLFFLRLPRIRAHIFFSAFCLMLAAYLLLRAPLIPEYVGLFAAKRVEYILLYLLPIPFMLFWRAMFQMKRRWFIPPYYAMLASFVYFPISSNSIPLWSKMLGYWYVAMIPAVAVILFTLIKNAYRGNNEARILLGGTLVFTAAILNDVLEDRSLIRTARVVDFGFLAFVSCMAVSLIRSFVALQRQSEETLLRLTEVDQLKERLVSNVTQMLIAPAGAILSAASSLDVKHRVPASDYAELYNHGAELNRALDDVLLLSRIQSGVEAQAMRPIGKAELARIFPGVSFPAESRILATEALLRALHDSISVAGHLIRYESGGGLSIRVSSHQNDGHSRTIDDSLQQAVVTGLGGSIFRTSDGGRVIRVPEAKSVTPWSMESATSIRKTAFIRPVWSLLASGIYLGIGQPILAGLQSVHFIWSTVLLFQVWRSKTDGRAPTSSAVRTALDVIAVSIGLYASGGMDSPVVLALAIPVVFSSLGKFAWRGPLGAILGALLITSSEILTSYGIVPDLNILGKGSTPTQLWQIAITGILILGALLSLAIAAHRLYVAQADAREAAEAERRKSEKTTEFSRKLYSTTDFSNLIESIVSYLQSEFGIDSLILLLPEPETSDLVTAKVFTAALLNEQVVNAGRGLRIPPAPNGGLIRRVFERQKPLFLRVKGETDIFRRPYPGIEMDKALVEAAQFDWVLLVPMVVQGNSIGIILCTSYEHPKGLTRDELSAVYGFCSQVAGAVHGANVLNQIRTEKDRAEAMSRDAEIARNEYEELNEFARLLNSSSGLSGIFDKICDRLSVAANVDTVWLSLIDRASNELYTYWGKHPGEIGQEEIDFFARLRIPMNEYGGTMMQTVIRKVPLHIPDLSKIRGRTIVNALDGHIYKITRTDIQIQSNSTFRGLLQIPLVLNDDVIGILNVARFNRTLEMSPDEIRRLLAFSQQITGALNNAILIDQVRTRGEIADQARADFQALADLSREASQNPEIESIIESVHKFCSARFGTEFIALFQVSPDETELEVRHIVDPGNRITGTARALDFKAIRLPLIASSGSLFRTYQRMKTVYLRKIKPGWLRSEYDRQIVDLLQFESFVHVPLLTDGKTIGILALTAWKDMGLTKQDLELLQAMADQVAGAVRSAQQMKEIIRARAGAERARMRAEVARAESEIAQVEAERQRRGTQKLNEISRALNATTDLQEVSARMLEHLRNEYSIESCLLMLPDQSTGILRPSILIGPARELEIGRTLQIPVGPEGGMVRRAFERKKPLFVKVGGARDIFRIPYPGMDTDKDFIQRLGLEWFLILPLVVQGRAIGALMCTSYEKSGGLRSHQVAEIGAFADQIAGAVYSSNLMSEVDASRKEAEKARADTEVLAELARQANQAVDLSGVLGALTNIIRARFGADGLGLLTVNTELNQLELTSCVRGGVIEPLETTPANFRILPLVPETGSLFQIWKKKRSFYSNRISQRWLEGSPMDAAIAEYWNMKWLMEIPLLLDDKVVALLTLSGPDENRLSRADIQFCERLASQVAGAVRALQLLDASVLARNESDRLLANILPATIAEELKHRGSVEPLFYDSVSVLFTDFVGFTRASENLLPDELVAELDGCFSQFDAVVARNNMEKLKTIGDSYMCAAGLPQIRNTHAIDACLTALEFRDFMLTAQQIKSSLGMEFWQVRIGIHSGSVTAGVIGTNKFAYDIWGDTVNTASRMESSGEPGKVNISGDTYNLVKDFFDCEYRGKVKAKGKGEVDMYFLQRIKPELSADDVGLMPNAKFEVMRMGLESI